MDSLQKQIGTLTTRVEALYQLIEQMNGKLSQTMAECKSQNSGSGHSQSGSGLFNYAYQRPVGLDAAMESHKDVIVDHGYMTPEEPTGEQELAPEIQIRRLTAQLTAAYNRIAALEEQLLAHRVH
ncbi:hypothetical protein BST81_12000 [Leptolyngbya sp. 'hensonii']|uniref:hypothetical protein n=1 Tax=Leptolyngbya sp. 'hensonii' TaxID=1922337 RepID=UPI00094FEA36|nr:hypothetical protein [Leptolyngbya sp. 'hensonii']OLP17788.1 hypothetical protein BST81_12000 [Leptolyngbya sp. 'hensonii']